MNTNHETDEEEGEEGCHGQAYPKDYDKTRSKTTLSSFTREVIHASLTGEGKYMDAESAKKLTQSNLKGPVIEPYLEIIYKKIEIAAKSGKFSIIRPFSEIRTTWPGHEIQKAVWQELRANGYEVTHHSNPDPGYPCSSDYDEISWS